ncbi:transglycosylase family protein [Streptomyces sp. NPDC055078]
MLSGNGRHRRPRQAPALIVAAGVTGSAIAIPLLGAGSASAVEGSAWDRVAECESGGLWSADTGNGYYGGLQFSQETWEAFGGTQFASRADLASRSQQISVAEKVLAAQGTQPWASCAGIAGLVAQGAGAGVDPGTSASPTPKSQSPQQPVGSPKPSTGETGAAGSTAPAKPVAPEKSAVPTQGIGNGAAPTGPATGETGTGPAGDDTAGPNRGEPAKEPTEATGSATPTPPGTGATPAEPLKPGGTEGAGQGRTADPGHPSRGDGPARDGAPGGDSQTGGIETPGAGVPSEGVADAAPGSYTVRPGDNLWAIADERKLPGGWGALYEANRKTVGGDPDLIHPGQSLDLSQK